LQEFFLVRRQEPRLECSPSSTEARTRSEAVAGISRLICREHCG
jgi:hypothetical protein